MTTHKARVQIPLIGQGPDPEEVQELHQQARVIQQVWPEQPFPFGTPKQEPYWMGRTLMDSFAIEVMKQVKWSPSMSDEVIAEKCKFCWKVSSAMLGTRPLKAKGDDSE